MKHTFKLLLGCVLVSLYSCGGETDNDTDTDIADSTNYDLALATSSTDCTNAPASWFEEDGNGNRRTLAPNEGITSPFANNDSVTNCDFQRWSWQKFLWLTNEYNGRPLFMDSLHQVTASGTLVSDPSLIVLIDTSQASDPVVDILQTPVLASGTPPQTTVYSSIFQDDLMYQTMLQYAPIANTDPAAIENVSYPVGSLELKTTWIATSGLADSSAYFITDGTINGVPNRVALLAMHVVGVVENHPEFVWATFEHDELAPMYDWDAATPTSDAVVTSDVNYPFFGAGATATTANITNSVADAPHTDVFAIYKYGIPVEKVDDGTSPNGVQQYMSTCETNPSTSFDNIDNLNQSVKSQLTGVWNKYFLNGSLWINPGDRDLAGQIALLDSLGFGIGNVAPGQFARGSVSSYNITMETYVQAGFRKIPWTIHETSVSDLANCFSCHSAANYINADSTNTSPLYISHIFTGYMKTLKGASRSEIKLDHHNEIKASVLQERKKRTK
jgi:hypothetical protein